MAVRFGGWKSNADCVKRVQPKDCAKTMIREVIVASSRILVDFEEEVGGLRDLDVFLDGHIADDGQPGIQLVRNSRLGKVGVCDNCDS
jgi:hypothetical protein